MIEKIDEYKISNNFKVHAKRYRIFELLKGQSKYFENYWSYDF